MQNLKRQIAYKVKIKDLLIGEYVKKEGSAASFYNLKNALIFFTKKLKELSLETK